MATRLSDLPRSKVMVFTGVVAILLVWRVLAAGIDAWSERYGTRGLELSSKSPSPAEMERSLRERIARDPADATALLVLALTLEQQEKPDDGAAAMNQALLLAPHDSQTLMQAAGFFLRI